MGKVMDAHGAELCIASLSSSLLIHPGSQRSVGKYIRTQIKYSDEESYTETVGKGGIVAFLCL